MKHVKINAFDIPDSWFKTVSTIWNEGEIFTVGSGSECTETKKLDLTLHIKHPEIYPLVDDKAPTDMKHVQDYSLTYLYSNFKGDYSYTYGSRLREPVDQIQAITNAIVQCRSNRQLTMTIRVPEDVDNHEPPCVPPETLITTINGFKEAKDVDVGDLVLTHLGRWKKVTKKYQRLYNGEMIKIISSQFNYNLSLTPEHPLYIVEINHCLWNKKEPKLVCKPNCKKQFSCYGKHGVECPKLYRNYLKEWCEAKDINNKHYLIIPKFIETYNEKFSDEEMYIIGLWLAEGDYIKDDGIRFNLGKHETKLINKTVLLMKKIYGLNPHFDNSGQGTSRITFYSTKLVKYYMSVFGKGARNKTLPFNFLYLPNNSLQSLIKGYVDGDGTILNNGYTFFTTSKNLKNIFTLILNKLGVCPSISTVKIKENVYKGRTIKSNGDGYKIDVCLNKKHQKYWEDNDNYYIPIKEYYNYDYEGEVFNFEVEEDNSYIANGITVHNCLTMIDLEVLNNKVNMTTYFRSWDTYAGLPENIAGLYLLLEAIVNDVNEILISEGCPDEDLLETGEMIFHSKNAHIYKRQYVFVEELLKTKTSRLAEKLIDKELKN